MKLRRTACWVSIALLAGSAAAADSLQAHSNDGRWLVVAAGRAVAVYDSSVRVKTLVATDRESRSAPSTVTAIHYLPTRKSFAIAFGSLAELWELSIDPQAAPIFDGLVHDYRQGEAIAASGFLGARRTRLEHPLRGLAFDASGAYALGRVNTQGNRRALLELVHLDIRRAIGRFAVGGDPDLPAAQTLHTGDRRMLKVPDRQGGPATLIDLQRVQLVDPGIDTR